MSRFLPCRDMSADEIVQCGYDAMAIIDLCIHVANDLSERETGTQLAGAIGTALKLANELVGAVHDTVEIHEGLIGEARHERAA